MIRTFGSKQTARLWQGERVRAFDGCREKAERKLAILDAATSLEVLGGLPGNRLEVLRADRKEQHSIRINDQWRVCFRWHDAGAERVAIKDNHLPGWQE